MDFPDSILPFLSSIAPGRSLRLHPVSAQSYCVYVQAGRPAFARPCEGSIVVYRLRVRPYFPAASRMSGSSNLESFRNGL